MTDGRFADTSPVFTADGLYLAFLSQRSFDPVYDAHTFDLAFPLGSRPYLVPLAAATPSPFGPLPGGRPVGGRAKDDADSGDAEPDRPGPAEGDTGRADPAPRPVTVDPAGLADRIVQVPVAESRYSSLRAVKGGLAWLREPVIGNLGEARLQAQVITNDPSADCGDRGSISKDSIRIWPFLRLREPLGEELLPVILK